MYKVTRIRTFILRTCFLYDYHTLRCQSVLHNRHGFISCQDSYYKIIRHAKCIHDPNNLVDKRICNLNIIQPKWSAIPTTRQASNPITMHSTAPCRWNGCNFATSSYMYTGQRLTNLEITRQYTYVASKGHTYIYSEAGARGSRVSGQTPSSRSWINNEKYAK